MSHHLPLPGLMPNDPEKLLSPEARQRISRAVVEQQRIRAQIMSTLETRYRAESSGDVGFGEYLSSGSAFIDLAESHMEAARIVLRVESEEYRKLGLPGGQFREIMREKIEGLVYSLELSVLQNRALELEFVWATSQQAEDEPRSVERSEETAPAKRRVRALQNIARGADQHKPVEVARTITNPAATARIGAYMRDHAQTQAGLADKAHIGERTLRRLLKTNTASIRTWEEVAKAIGTTPEELLKTGHPAN